MFLHLYFKYCCYFQENVLYVGLCNFYLETETYKRQYGYNTRNCAAFDL